MSKMIFVSLPVSDLTAATAFYAALGFEKNPAFSDDATACMVWSESIHVMLLTHGKWSTFTDRPVAPSTTSEVMLALSCDSKRVVDAMNEAAAARGGRADVNKPQDLGFMYNRSFVDADGHVWEAVWMDPSAMSGTGQAG